MRVVGLELVDDHVPHPDRPAAEGDEEQRQERQEPVVGEVPDEGPREATDRGRVVAEADREDVPGDGEHPDEQDPEPHVRRRGQRIADRKQRVVEGLAARGERAELVARVPAEGDRRHEQRERVRDRVGDDRHHRRRELQDAPAEVAVEERDPEVPVLLPQRQVEIERALVVGVHLVRHLRILDLDPAHQRVHGVARHQVRDRPVDAHGDHEGQCVDDHLSQEIARH